MKKINIEDVCKICKGQLLCGKKEIDINNFSIDTRTLEKGDTYIAIKGESSNGNKYVKNALDKGAIACIVDEDIDLTDINKNKTIIKVEDGLKALQDLASYKRSLYNIPVVAVTGSVGKTSTKDIIASVLSKKYKVLKTEGNFNNHLGLPLTLLKLKDHTAVVVEMGMNHFGEIATLTNIAKPTMAVITNIGTSHIGNLGSRENILKAKLEILEGLKQNGKIIINNDNDLLHNWAQTVDRENIITYGIENKSTFNAENIKEEDNCGKYKINTKKEEYNVKVPVVGKHFIYNSLCAVAVAEGLGIETKKIIQGILEFKLTAKRMDFRTLKNGATVLADYYNASYDSMKSALEVVKNYNAHKKIAVLGDMLELGDFAEKLHKDVGIEVYNNNIDILITVGDLAKNIAKTAKKIGVKEVYTCENNKEAVKILNEKIQKDDIVLLKASNGMHFGEIFEAL